MRVPLKIKKKTWQHWFFIQAQIKMSAYQRVQQWATFARVWHLYDCNWQNPFDSAKLICKYLLGQHKPIYHSSSK